MQRSYVIKNAVIAVVVVLALHHAYNTAAAAQNNPLPSASSAIPTEAQPATPAQAHAATSNQVTMPSQPVAMTVAQQLRANLVQSGFTDIKIVPDSFRVQATDRSGHPVTLVIRAE